MEDKLYICIREDYPDYMTPTLVGHAVLRHHLKMIGDNSRYNKWLIKSWKKCVVKVNAKEFAKIAELPDTVKTSESTTLNGEVSCVTIIATKDEHNVLSFAKLWKPSHE